MRVSTIGIIGAGTMGSGIAHARLRSLTRAPGLEIHPHEPPDVMGCFVLVPTGRTG